MEKEILDLDQLVRVEEVAGSPLEAQLVVNSVVILRDEKTMVDRLELAADIIENTISLYANSS